MNRRGTAALGMACAFALVTAACGSDDETSGGSSGGGGGSESATIKVGVLGSISGANSASYPGFKLGVDARLEAYEADDSSKCSGLDFDVVEADDMTSEQGNLTATQQLVEQDKVFSILTASTQLAASADYLQSQGTIVIGYPLDGPSPQWYQTDANFFKVAQVPQSDQVFSTLGNFFKDQDATKVESVAFNIEPALVGMRATTASAKAAGLKTSEYGNIDLSTGDVSGAVNDILSNDADAVWAAITPEVGVQLVTALKQAGFDGVINLPIGYGGDLLQDQNQVQASQGVTFASATTPVELETDATKAEVAALKASGSENDIPTLYESAGYLSADLLIRGFETAGCDTTPDDWATTVRDSTDWDGGGLLPKPQDFTDPTVSQSCSYFLELDGNEFKPLSDEAVCGDEVDG